MRRTKRNRAPGGGGETAIRISTCSDNRIWFDCRMVTLSRDFPLTRKVSYLNTAGIGLIPVPVVKKLQQFAAMHLSKPPYSKRGERNDCKTRETLLKRNLHGYRSRKLGGMRTL